MGLHQTSVYAGTAAGGIVAGYLGQWYGWRSPFWTLGLIGLGFAVLLPLLLIEPVRGKSDDCPKPEPPAEDDFATPARGDFASPAAGLWTQIATVVTVPPAAMLPVVFAGANFVAAQLLSLPPHF